MAPEKYRARPAGSKPRPAGQRSAQAGCRPAGQRSPAEKKPLSLEEKRRRERERRERLRQEREERERLAALRRQRRKRLFRLCFVCSLILVALYWSWVALSIHLRDDGTKGELPLLLFLQGEREETERFEPEEVCIGGVKYLPITFLEEYMAISQFGDHLTRSFLICANGEYATFYLGSEEAVINGQHVSMKAPSILKDDVLYLPLDFYDDKMSCFEFGANNTTYGADVLTLLPEVAPAFVFHPVTTENPVDYATVPVAPVIPADPATGDTTAPPA